MNSPLWCQPMGPLCLWQCFLFYFLITFHAFNNIVILAPAVAICFLIKISAKRTSVETAQRSVQRFIRKLFLRKLGKDFELRSYFQIFQSYSPFLPKILKQGKIAYFKNYASITFFALFCGDFYSKVNSAR